MPYFEKNDLKMFYEDIGTGAPVIFMHGSFSRGIIAFASQIQKFQFSFRGIYPDLRGHGRTEAASMNWTTPLLAEDIIDLLDHLGIEQAHIIGHSMGADAAMYCAFHHPDRVKTMTSISSGGCPNADVKAYLEKYCPENIDCVKYCDFIEFLKADFEPAHRGNWEDFLRETIKIGEKYPDFSDEELQRITAPFLLIYGSDDILIKIEEIERLRRNIPNFTEVKIEGAKHFPHVTGNNAEEVNDILFEFLKKHL
ncbi:MAG: alpha/beta hydrolase [Methanimicrococcus sp.]|nr:alpha/beta hydrolase [Methanimicrococcus sp.]